MVRNLIDPWNHVRDIKTVLQALVKGDLYSSKSDLEEGKIISPDILKRIDRQRILLWGTSFAGGHMIQVGQVNILEAFIMLELLLSFCIHTGR